MKKSKKKEIISFLEKVRRISSLAKFSYVRQPQPLGDGHALHCASHLIFNEPVLVMFGDTLYEDLAAITEFRLFSPNGNQVDFLPDGWKMLLNSHVDQDGNPLCFWLIFWARV